MTDCVIAKGRWIELHSLSNGAAYDLINGNLSVFFQYGDDAAGLREQWDRMEANEPDTPTGILLERLWSEYAGLAL